MELTDLAAKQKRIAVWKAYAENEVQEPGLRQRTLDRLREFSRVLAEVWTKQLISDSDQTRITSLERELQSLNEEARMTVVGRRAGPISGRG